MHVASKGLSASDKLHDFVDEAFAGHEHDDDIGLDSENHDRLFDVLWITATKFVKSCKSS